MKILQRDHKKADHHKDNPPHPSFREDFANKEDSPDLGEERSRAGNGVYQGEITSPVGLHKTDEINGFEETRGDDKTPEVAGGIDEERGKDSKTDEEREIEKDPP